MRFDDLLTLLTIGGHLIIGNDAHAALGRRIPSDNVTPHLEADSRAETDRPFTALKVGGTVDSEPTELP